MSTKGPCFIPEFAKLFLDKKNYAEDYDWGDAGLNRVQGIVISWIKSKGGRNINQYTFRGVEKGSSFTAPQLRTLATYMWSVSLAEAVSYPSAEDELEQCWLSKAGAQQPSGRRRIPFDGAYYLNHAFNAVVMHGPPHFEWSHLCNDVRCERPSHLVDEDHVTNVSRSACPGIVFCPESKAVFVVCKHEPRCKHVHATVKGPLTVAQYKGL